MFAKLALSLATALSLVAAPVTGTALSASSNTSTASSLSAQASVLPTSPFYGVMQVWNSLQLDVPMSAEAKANLELQMARADAAAAYQMLATGHTSLAVGPLQDYTQAMTRAQAELKQSPADAKTELGLTAAQAAGDQAATLAAKDGLSTSAQAALSAAASNSTTPGQDVALAHLVAKITGKSAPSILALRAAGYTWAEIAQMEGLKLGVRMNPEASVHANAHAQAGVTGSTTPSGQANAQSQDPTSTSGSTSDHGTMTTSPASGAQTSSQGFGFTVFGVSF